MRLLAAVVIACLTGLVFGQSQSTARYPVQWEYEFSQLPNIYIPEMAVVDAHGVVWVLCSARMGNEGYAKQHVTQAIFRIDERGRQLSTSELDLPLSPQERQETSDYRLAPLANGEMGLAFNKIRFEARGQSYLGAYYTTLRPDGSVASLHEVSGPGLGIGSFLTLKSGDVLIGGQFGGAVAFDSGGAFRWKKFFGEPQLAHFDSTNLKDGSICVSAWTLTSKGVLNKLRVMQLDQRGNIAHTVDVAALRGQVAAGPDGSCAVLYDRAPSVYKGDYSLTAFDLSFLRKWTVPVPQSTVSGSEFHLVPLADGYLVQINNVLVEFDWTGKELWSDVEVRGTVKTIVAPVQDGFFLVTQDLDMNHGFHVKRATAARR